MPILPDDPTSPTLRIAGSPFGASDSGSTPAAKDPTDDSDPEARAATEDIPDASSKPEAAAEAEADETKEEEPKERAYSGAHLREIRESQGLSLNEISERTKISRTVLLAIEDERYEDIPNARVYVRGFVRCVARELGLDLDAVSQAYVPRWERWYAGQSPP